MKDQRTHYKTFASLAIILLTFLLATGVYLFIQSDTFSSRPNLTTTVSPDVVPTEEPSPTPSS